MAIPGAAAAGSSSPEADTGSVLRAFAANILTSSRNERKAIFEATWTHVSRDDVRLPDAAVKALCKLLPAVLARYKDGGSRFDAHQLVTLLLLHSSESGEESGKVAVTALTHSLLDSFGHWGGMVPTAANARTAVAALTWAAAVYKSMPGEKEITSDCGKKLVRVFGALSHVVFGCGDFRLMRAGEKVLRAMWGANQSAKPGLEMLIRGGMVYDQPMIGLASRYIDYKASALKEDAVPLKKSALENLNKVVIGSRQRADEHTVRNAAPLLKHVTHEEFKELLLAPMQKSMLRNPEIVLGTVAIILENVNLDLSRYVDELKKPLGANLHAKEDATRADAAAATAALAAQCSDPEAVVRLLDALFAVLNGSEGKLSQSAHKVCLLRAAGRVSRNAVTGGALQGVCRAAVKHFVKLLETESHEGTLVEALDTCGQWMAKLSGDVPPEFVAWFPKGITAKTATSSVRCAYFTCLQSALSKSTAALPSALPLIPTLMRTMDNCAKQASQVATVSEGAHAAKCLVRLSLLEAETEKQLAEFWKLSLDEAKQIFVNERFLLAASCESLRSLVDVAEKVLLEKITSAADAKCAPWMRVLCVALTCHSSRTRRHAQASVKKVVSSGLGGDLLASVLVDALDSHLRSSLVTAVPVLGAEHREDGAGNGTVSGKFVLDALEAAVSDCRSEVSEKRVALARHLLLPAHLPAVAAVRPGGWVKLVRAMELDPAEGVAELGEEALVYLREAMANPDTAESAKLAVGTLISINPDIVVPSVVKILREGLKKSNIHVTVDDYETYLTPDGELFDKRVLEAIQNEKDSTMNMKRESKAYSYKEQMEELALRKEIEEKRKREGKHVEPKLNPKQKELLNVQLEKERKTRAHVASVVETVRPALSLLSAAVVAKPQFFSSVVSPILEQLVAAFSSPAFAKQSSEIFFDLRRAVLTGEDDETLFQVIAAVTIQILKPSFVMETVRSDADTLESSRSVLLKIWAETCGEGEEACPLPTPALSYAFTLLQHAVRKSLGDEDLVQKGCNVVSEHAQLRGLDDVAETVSEPDDLHPKYLPRAKMLNLMIDVIGGTSGRTQQTAVASLVEVALSASGGTGCARASKDEIDVLLGALVTDSEAVRDAGLRGLKSLVRAFPSAGREARIVARRTWVARFDPVEENRLLAKELWDEAGFDAGDEDLGLCDDIIDDVLHPVGCVRQAAAEGLAKLLGDRPGSRTAGILDVLLATYSEKLEMIPPVIDHLGRTVEPAIDHWEPRSGIGMSLSKLAPLYDKRMVEKAVSFFVPGGLGDRNEAVRKCMLEAAVVTINLHGKDTAEELLPVFEGFMERKDSGTSDDVRQSVVILMGSLAKHLDASDPKVRPIMRQLIVALNTPSQQVQEAVANCLPPLVVAIKEEAPGIVSNLINTLLKEDRSYGERKGAAYGIAGIVKGLGILSLKQLDIMGRLTEAIQNKKSATHREGALFAFEMLCGMLGRLFEPYIVHILPHLLLCFGDSVPHVRDAADDTAKAVMSKLSAHGVKLVLPSLLNALEEDQWRTKTGSVELLGAMAFCAPKQLSSCLPSIVPKLIEVLSDSHHKVQKAGAQALKVIGSVIRNPEIAALVPILLRALADPAQKTGPCLQTLLDTKFVHFIDAPSLALIMPVVQRAFKDRSTETRKMAAQIIGNMYSLTDEKDLSPYLPGIIPGLKNSLLDPVPEVRAVSARALGAMVKGMGESSFEELLPWLMSTLTSESSSVDRSGAAQGLAEVVGGLGVEKMNALMPDIIRTSERGDIAPHVKDGYIMMFIYMPTVFPEEFTEYIGQIISPILRALADENEYVRDTAYMAGKRLVTTYAETSVSLLLPELEKGLFDENWRIRHQSIQLLGDLLYKISGVSGKMTTETAGEDQTFGTDQSQRVIIRLLGMERRDRVLAGLYMGRSDVALMVRQAALHVWKIIVSNTPKTLREILPTLFNLLLSHLASNSYDKRQVAARTLGDLVKKLGERVLPEIIPILEKGLESEHSEKRQGVCVGLSEIMSSTSREMVLSFADSLVPTVRKALCDELPEVRAAAAKTFDSLHNTMGVHALDDILPQMLKQLDDPDLHDNALDGLKQVMAIKSRAVLPYLVPQLIAPPVNMRALASLAPVAGEALHRHLSRILPAILQALAAAHGTPGEAEAQEFGQTVVLSVSDDEDSADAIGISTVMDELFAGCKAKHLDLRRAAVTLLHAFCAESKADYSQYVPQLIRTLVLMFTEEDPVVLSQAWNALSAVTKTLDANDQMAHVSDVRQAVRFAASDVRKADGLMPGFCLAKGIAPVLPIFRESILNGAPELKESAATGLGEVIKVTSAAALKPSVVHITGPLIRILGDRFSHGVKTAVLDTLAVLLAKAKDMLKPFFPQLQTTFMKALNDANRNVRLKAGIALGHLITIHMRPDPLFNEIFNGIKGADDASTRDTYIQALRGCAEPSGDRMSAPVRKQILALLTSYLGHQDDSSRVGASGCLGALTKFLPEEELSALVEEHMQSDDVSVDWTLRHGRSTLVFVALKAAADRLWVEGWSRKLEGVLRSFLNADRIPIAENAVRAIGYLFEFLIKEGKELPADLASPFAKMMNHSSNDVKLLVTAMATHLSKSAVAAGEVLPAPDFLKVLLPMLVNGTKEKNSAVKSSSETALVAVMAMRHGGEGQKKCLALLDSGAKDALSDVISKVLQRVANQPEGKEETIDNTVLV